MQLPDHLQSPPPDQRERGQALVEYILIVVLVAIIFGIALASTGDVIGNVFSNSVNDLLRQTEITGTIPNVEDFWKTVTAAFENPPAEKPLPTNTPAPPTTEPTAGPSPTHTPITPTPSPSETRTPTLTPTPWDELHDLDFYDSVDAQTLKWWRADANINLMGKPWTGQFFSDTGLSVPDGDPIKGFWKLDFTGDANTPWVAGKKATNFSARFTRTIELSAPRSITIRMLIDDGARVLVDGNQVPGLQQLGRTGDPAWFTGSQALTAGEHTITVEYKQASGNSRLEVLVQGSGANPDDTGVTSGGIPNANVFACGWGQNFRANGNDANTEIGMFDEFVDGELPQGSRCNLELRGAVKVPSTTVNPQLVFYDVWDLKAPVSAWIEIGEYIQELDPLPGGTPAPVPSLDRDAVNWRKINLHTGGTKNYNYTRNVISLKDVTPALDFSKPITFRFVIQNTTSTTAGSRWYIDDILVQEAGPEKNFKLNHPVWTLDEDFQMEDFIFNGGKSIPGVISGWRLTSNNKLGPSGMAFHDSVGPTDNGAGIGGGPGNFTSYKRHTEAPNDTAATSIRLHTLEFNGWVDLDPSVLVDAENNKGDPVLSFYQAYDVGSKTGLEVQWTTDPFDDLTTNWTTFADGVIRDVNATTTITNLTLQEYVVRLKGLPGNPSKIRIRFVMKVPYQAVRRDGWWIDQIRIGREETPKWVDYPFKDDAQYFSSGPYRFFGKWTQTEATGRRSADEPLVVDPNNPGGTMPDPEYKRKSYASSPGGNYDAAQKTWMEMRFAVDMYNDTQTDPMNEKTIWGRTADTNPPVSNRSNSFGGPAVNPILSFYHSRNLGNSDDFLVQWKRLDAPDSAWKTIWLYKNGMATNPTSPSSETAKQDAWERVEIDLADVMKDLAANNTANVRDDDIVFRFYLDAKGTTTGKGIFIDDILLQERPNQDVIEYKLWPENENRLDPVTNQPLGLGDGTFFTDDADASSTNRLWTESWFNGGDWFAVNWSGSSRLGPSGFHDSPINGQDKAPDGVGNDVGEVGWVTVSDRFAVLELNNIIDLRGVDGETEAPILTFWTRYHIGGLNSIRVEISEEMRKANGSAYTETELDNDIKSRCNNQPVRQCYEQRRGWKPWVKPALPWERKPNANSELREYGWERGQIDLRPYSYNVDLNQPGKRIRIRFVYDSLANNNNPRDGWYLDNIVIQYGKPEPLPTVILAEGTYDNTAGSMIGMIGEGNWGLDPNIVEGGGGSPTTFGLWDAYWWDCTNCQSVYGGANFREGAKNMLEHPNRPTATNRTGTPWGTTVSGLNYNMGNGKPPGAPSSFPTNYFVGEFKLTTPIAGSAGFPAGARTLLLESDDGARAKIQELDGTCTNTVNDNGWNIINNWKDQGPTTYSGSMSLATGKCYRITVQYYEKDGSTAMLRASIGSGKYSYSDSPKIGGTTSRDVYPIPLANTSLRINQTFDLKNIPASAVVVMAYRTKYRLGSNTTGGVTSKLAVEVSSDGGFNWVQTGLNTATGGFTFSGPNISNGIVDPDPSANVAWSQRLHNLNSFKDKQIVIRFRYDRQGEYCMRTRVTSSDTNPIQCNPSNANSGPEFGNGYFDGWWISRITIGVQ